MFVQERRPRHGAYLLRYWEVRSISPGQPSTWQFSLEAAGSGDRHAFHELAELVAFLERELEGEGAEPGGDGRMWRTPNRIGGES